MMEADFELLKDTPGFKNILKAILKNQLKQIVKSLSVYGGEETILISTSLSDGAIHHLGSPSTTGFLDNKDDLKLQFLGHCLQNSHKSKKEYSRSADIIRDTQTSRANVEQASPAITKLPESFTSPVVTSEETPKVGRKRGRPKGKVSVPTAKGSNAAITGGVTGQKRPSETETTESLMKRRNVPGSISVSHQDSASEINEEGTCTLKLEVEHSDLQTAEDSDLHIAGNLTGDSSSLADNLSRGKGAIETHDESEGTQDKSELKSSNVTNNKGDSNDASGVTVKLEPPDDDDDDIEDDDFDGDSDDETWTPELETPGQSANNPKRNTLAIKRQAFTAKEKLAAVAYADTHGNRATGRKFNVDESCVRQWRKQQSQLEEMPSTKQADRGTFEKFPQLELLVYSWVLECRSKGIELSTGEVLRQARRIARKLHIPSFKGSPDWYYGFMKRKKLSRKMRSSNLDKHSPT